MNIRFEILNAGMEAIIDNRIVEYNRLTDAITDLGIEFYGTCALKISNICEHIIFVDYDGFIKNYCRELFNEPDYRLRDELNVDIKSILFLEQETNYNIIEYNNLLVYTEQGEIYHIGYNNFADDDFPELDYKNIEFTKISKEQADYLLKNSIRVNNLIGSQRSPKSAMS